MALMFTIPNRRFSTLFSFCNLEVLVGTRTWNLLQFDNALARQVNTWEQKWLWSDGVGSGSGRKTGSVQYGMVPTFQYHLAHICTRFLWGDSKSIFSFFLLFFFA
jgi:hypothetical protein